MPENHVFEYAVIRVVPRVEREEFINVGVILFCKRTKFLQSIIQIDEQRMAAFSSNLEIDMVKANLNAFAEITKGNKSCGAIAALDEASRFRWLTATRSTVVQTSKVHPGLTADCEKTLQRIFNEMVG
ncbi:DUF3037 domain-containing protein [Mucilaginibacter auburnensis]|uniref:DUF3037 family protein n=1 Tax=Mucilaginibacter auburnensis TaxID=1457233 RepID=A0A2H9VLN1_9SPHI|nr:DUF3037 domain-containing protein [Mucilaginibacter auburnensis]PJJ79222.1 Protein of unknown function (DUF3037) [Mucilaginibacter auburnensis]